MKIYYFNEFGGERRYVAYVTPQGVAVYGHDFAGLPNPGSEFRHPHALFSEHAQSEYDCNRRHAEFTHVLRQFITDAHRRQLGISMPYPPGGSWQGWIDVDDAAFIAALPALVRFPLAAGLRPSPDLAACEASSHHVQYRLPCPDTYVPCVSAVPPVAVRV